MQPLDLPFRFRRPSIGIAFALPSSSPAGLLKQADIAMYQAKSLGKARYVVYDSAMQEEFNDRLAAAGVLAPPVAPQGPART